jgi:hypothetical protein
MFQQIVDKTLILSLLITGISIKVTILDKNGIGDIPYRPVKLIFNVLVEQNKPTMILLNSSVH